MRLIGKLFVLRRDVVLGRNVLDVPSIFWEEASLHALYEAGRAYFEIGERVQGLNERITGARGLVRCRPPTLGDRLVMIEALLPVICLQLDAMHEHMNNSAMERITWIIIWYASITPLSRASVSDVLHRRLIVVNIIVELVRPSHPPATQRPTFSDVFNPV